MEYDKKDLERRIELERIKLEEIESNNQALTKANVTVFIRHIYVVIYIVEKKL